MRGGWRLLAVVSLLCAATVCSAVRWPSGPKLPVPSNWELDQLRSDFGGGPMLRSVTFTVTSDKPSDLSMRFVTEDSSGRTTKASWTGPQNGELLPVENLPGSKFGIDRKGHEQLLLADGTTLDGVLSISKDKGTLLLRETLTTKDGNSYPQVLMFNPMD